MTYKFIHENSHNYSRTYTRNYTQQAPRHFTQAYAQNRMLQDLYTNKNVQNYTQTSRRAAQPGRRLLEETGGAWRSLEETGGDLMRQHNVNTEILRRKRENWKNGEMRSRIHQISKFDYEFLKKSFFIL